MADDERMRRMWDAAYPPADPPKGWDVVAGYIGGNTPHVWTDQEWDRCTEPFRLPIYVRSSGGNPNTDATAAVAWLHAHGVPPGCCVCLDFETRVDANYLHTFDWIVQEAGYLTMLYGTRYYVLQNPKPSGGYWIAEWPARAGTGVPHLYPGSAATQYDHLGDYDVSLVADTTLLWKIGDPMATLGPDDLNAIDDIVARYYRMLARGEMDEKGTLDPAHYATSVQFTNKTLGQVQNQIGALASADVIASAVAAKMPQGAGGLTVAQVKQAVKDALREGTNLL